LFGATGQGKMRLPALREEDELLRRQIGPCFESPFRSSRLEHIAESTALVGGRGVAVDHSARAGGSGIRSFTFFRSEGGGPSALRAELQLPPLILFL